MSEDSHGDNDFWNAVKRSAASRAGWIESVDRLHQVGRREEALALFAQFKDQWPTEEERLGGLTGEEAREALLREGRKKAGQGERPPEVGKGEGSEGGAAEIARADTESGQGETSGRAQANPERDRAVDEQRCRDRDGSDSEGRCDDVHDVSENTDVPTGAPGQRMQVAAVEQKLDRDRPDREAYRARGVEIIRGRADALTLLAQVISGERQWAIVHAECLSLMRSLPDRIFDHIITDPPYSAHVHTAGVRATKTKRGRSGAGNEVRQMAVKRIDDYAHASDADLVRWSRELARLAWRWAIVFSDFERGHQWGATLRRFGLEYVRPAVWVKSKAMPQITGDRPGSRCEAITVAHARDTTRKAWNAGGDGNAYFGSVVSGKEPDRREGEKPVSLMIDLVNDFSNAGEVVFDPFNGRGTTGVACIRNGRRYFGIERDYETWRNACDRLSAEDTGQSVVAWRSGQTTISQMLERRK